MGYRTALSCAASWVFLSLFGMVRYYDDLLEARVVGSRARTIAVFLAKMVLIASSFVVS